MNAATYSRRNLFRRRGRAILTIIVVALAVFIFCAIRAFVAAFNANADQAQADRLATRHKVSITMNLPKHYIDQLREVPGVKSATWANWFGAKDPRERVPFFAGFAVDQDSYFDVADDVLTLMERLNKDLHKTIFMVTHDPAAAERAGVVRKLDKGALQ